MSRRLAPYKNRFQVLFRTWIAEAIAGRTQVDVAGRAGMHNATLSEQSRGVKPATLETVDKVSQAIGLTTTQLLTRLRDIAIELDRKMPGWDMAGVVDLSADPPPVTPETIAGVLEAESKLMKAEAEAHARRAKRVRKPRAPKSPPPPPRPSRH